MNNSQEQAPRLERTLGLGSVVAIGVAYTTPLIVLAILGVVSEQSNGTVPTAYLVTFVAMVFTAYSYGRMSSVHPISGSAYTYVGKEMTPQLGFLAGWIILLDYFFLPMVAWLIGAAYLSSQFPGIPTAVWILAFVLITTALNVIGIRVTAGINFLLVAFQILVLGIFVALSIGFFVQGNVEANLWSPFWNQDTTVGAIAGGAAIAAYSFIGFDAITTLTEETRDPKFKKKDLRQMERTLVRLDREIEEMEASDKYDRLADPATETQKQAAARTATKIFEDIESAFEPKITGHRLQ